MTPQCRVHIYEVANRSAIDGWPFVSRKKLSSHSEASMMKVEGMALSDVTITDVIKVSIFGDKIHLELEPTDYL